MCERLKEVARKGGPSTFMRELHFSNIKLLSVSNSGIEYLDADGEQSQIDFQVCRRNWINNRSVKLEDMKPEQAEWHSDCVGIRNIIGKPPYIEFFSEPHVKLIFDNVKTGREDFLNLQMQLWDLGALTFDYS